jgi:hypothetical protein
MKRPSPAAITCLIIGTICSLIDLGECLTQALVVIPIYHTGILTIIWSDYLLITGPVSAAWLIIGFGTWRYS